MLEDVEAIQEHVPAAEMERAMKIQEVILKAMAGKLKWWEAAEIIGVTDRTMRRWREKYAEHGYRPHFRPPIFATLRTRATTPP